MPLTRYERKERLAFGAQKQIAAEVGCAASVVSMVMNDKAQALGRKTVRKIKVAIARKIGMKVDDVFSSAA